MSVSLAERLAKARRDRNDPNARWRQRIKAFFDEKRRREVARRPAKSRLARQRF
jgi:hypothetical protein